MVGVPETVLAGPESDSPDGRIPEKMASVVGSESASETTMVVEYGLPATGSGMLVVCMMGEELTSATENDRESVPPCPSETMATNGMLCDEVASGGTRMTERTPCADSDSQVGSPEAVHEIGSPFGSDARDRPWVLTR